MEDLFTVVFAILVWRIAHEFANYFKHESFEEEQEWRLVGVVGPGERGKPQPCFQWRARGNLIVPYRSLEFDPTFVRQIVVGPGVELAHARSAIHSLTWTRGLTIEVTPSKSTFRP